MSGAPAGAADSGSDSGQEQQLQEGQDRGGEPELPTRRPSSIRQHQSFEPPPPVKGLLVRSHAPDG